MSEKPRNAADDPLRLDDRLAALLDRLDHNQPLADIRNDAERLCHDVEGEIAPARGAPQYVRVRAADQSPSAGGPGAQPADAPSLPPCSPRPAVARCPVAANPAALRPVAPATWYRCTRTGRLVPFTLAGW